MNKVYIVETWDIYTDTGNYIVAIAGSFELARKIAKAYVEAQMKNFFVEGPITEIEDGDIYYISFDNDKEHVKVSKRSLYMTDEQVDKSIKAINNNLIGFREEDLDDD